MHTVLRGFFSFGCFVLKQINEKKYETELLDTGITSIHKIGIAFRGKNAVVKSEL